MSKSKKTHGFTLIEIIVVVAILAVLMAVAVPSITKYLNSGEEAKALSESYACVLASDYYGVHLYAKDETPNVTNDFKNEILERADVNGKINGLIYKDNKTNKLLYKSPNGLNVLFEKNEYKFVDDSYSFGVPASNMLQILEDLKSNNQNIQDLITSGSLNSATKKLQQIYKEQNDGAYPPISTDVVDYLIEKGLKSDTANNLKWKPMIDGFGKIILVADTNPIATSSNATIIYANNTLFYHTNDNQKIDSHWIEEGKLTYDKDGFPIPRSGKWHKIESL